MSSLEDFYDIMMIDRRHISKRLQIDMFAMQESDGRKYTYITTIIHLNIHILLNQSVVQSKCLSSIFVQILSY